MKCFPILLLVVGLSKSASAAERFGTLTMEQMTLDQRKVAEAILAGPRHELNGLFNAWLRSPELADPLQKVGEYIRFKNSLPPHLTEFAILIVAREWTAQYEWYAHYPLAIKAGVAPKVLSDLAAGNRPAGMKPDEEIVYEFTIHLSRDRAQVPDKLFKAAVDVFGEQGVVDLIGVNGYYTTVAMTLNTAEVGLPPGSTPARPLKTLERKRIH